MKKYLFILAIGASLGAFAQPGNPSSPTPIDGGLSLLIAAGAGLGAKKVYDSKRKAE